MWLLNLSSYHHNQSVAVPRGSKWITYTPDFSVPPLNATVLISHPGQGQFLLLRWQLDSTSCQVPWPTSQLPWQLPSLIVQLLLFLGIHPLVRDVPGTSLEIGNLLSSESKGKWRHSVPSKSPGSRTTPWQLLLLSFGIGWAAGEVEWCRQDFVNVNHPTVR